ncbi:hypothetical protein LUX29_11590 [Aureimonas altamirensis]|uniref:HAD family hydrolase n=1 Tax=Aureimonas altamirensis TaxID=370622 RepID=UPI001E626E6C|nr:HAD family hydrolase [Aureimonas altamirensis]UHD43752.1 hypothetical protein LUX29_11590 [Aureimonas altamirensis]
MLQINSLGGLFSAESIERTLEPFQVISFDVFDTLLHRLVASPHDVFHIIERRYGMGGFAERRIQAEIDARSRGRSRFGSEETSIGEIYESFGLSETETLRGIEREIDVERSLLRPSPRGVAIYKAAKRLGKITIAVSDMYLSSDVIRHLLECNGIFVDFVMSSSDHRRQNIGKYNGKIFPIAAQQCGVEPGRMIHFGDNWQSDFVQATKAGLAAIHMTTNLHELFTDTRLNLHSIHLIDRAKTPEGAVVLGALAHRHAHGYLGLPFDECKAVSYFYGGMVALGLIKRIEEVVARHGIEKLLLLTRDGFAIADYLTAYGFDACSYDVVYSSRRMCLVPLLTRKEWWVLPMLFPKRHEAVYDLHVELQRLNLAHVANITNFVTEDWDEFVRHLESEVPWETLIGDETDVYRDYLRSVIGATPIDALAIVDVGWGLNSHRAIESILGQRLHGIYCGTHAHAYHTDLIDGSLFLHGQPSERTERLMGAVEVLELFFSDASPSAVRMERRGPEGLFSPVLHDRDPEDMSRDIYVRHVQRGIRTFLQDVKPFSGEMDTSVVTDLAAEVMGNIAVNPTPGEYETIGKIPHAREIGASRHSPISNWWRPPSHNAPPAPPEPSATGDVRPSLRVAARLAVVALLGAKNARYLTRFVTGRTK